jgi:hypothetical protein
MKLTKAAKIKLLENFYGLDYVFFERSVKEVEVCCPVLVTEYLAVKGALLSTLIEMYRLVKYTPKELTEKVDVKRLKKNSSRVAEWAREKAKGLLLNKRGRDYVKEQITKVLESDPSKKQSIDEVAERKIKEQAYSLAIDTMLIGRMIAEAKSYSKMNDWKGKILEESYKILRDNLIECAISMMDDDGK